MTVDRGRARVDPQARRRRGGPHRSIESAGRVDAGVTDDLSVRIRVPAADTAAGEVDEQVGSVDELGDQVRAIPGGIGGCGGAADRSRRVSPSAQCIEQLSADESRCSGNDCDRFRGTRRRCVSGFEAHKRTLTPSIDGPVDAVGKSCGGCHVEKVGFGFAWSGWPGLELYLVAPPETTSSRQSFHRV